MFLPAAVLGPIMALRATDRASIGTQWRVFEWTSRCDETGYDTSMEQGFVRQAKQIRYGIFGATAVCALVAIWQVVLHRDTFFSNEHGMAETHRAALEAEAHRMVLESQALRRIRRRRRRRNHAKNELQVQLGR